MTKWWTALVGLFAVRGKERRWAYVPIICVDSLIGLWGIAEGGAPAATHSIAIALVLIAQFVWPTFFVWFALLALYLIDVVSVLAAAHIPDDFGGLVLYGIPVALLLWARPRLYPKATEPSEVRRLSISFVLTSGSLFLLGLVDFGLYVQMRCCSLRSSAKILGTAIVPLLILASVAFAIRDILRPSTRWQAALALILSVPIGVMCWSVKLIK